MSDKELEQFDPIMVELAKLLRKWLGQAEHIHNIGFEVNIEGRTDGDLKIEYRLVLNYDSLTKGGQLKHLVAEALRRYSWAQNHAPICLPKVPNDDPN